jgi:hypothetical protein
MDGMNDVVMVRYAKDMPANYLPGLRDGMLARLRDLDLLPHHPTRPAVALPTNSVDHRSNGMVPVYEVLTLGRVLPATVRGKR